MAVVLPIILNRSSHRTLQDQVFQQIVELIGSGRLPPNTRIPASRQLAAQLGVSRNTITLAYERLASEGYVTSRPATGNFVTHQLPEAAAECRATMANNAQHAISPPIFTIRPSPHHPRADIDFGLRLKASLDFPTKVWRKKVMATLDSHAGRLGAYPQPSGEPRLRRAIASWLERDRGLTCHSDEIVIVSGCQQAYTVAAQTFLKPGDRVVVESPGHLGTWQAFQPFGVEIIPVPVDEKGLIIEALPPGRVGLVCVSPSHQCPVGGILPLDRRRRLIDWARQAGAYIIEDDCNGERALCWSGAQPPSLKALDPYGLVIYAGTFTKTMGAGLRLGYMVLPRELAAVAGCVKEVADGGNSWLEQMSLAAMIESGAFERHLDTLGHRWRARRDCLTETLHEVFGNPVLTGTQSGTHVAWLLPDHLPNAQFIAEMARTRGVAVHALPSVAVSGAASSRFTCRTLYLNYSGLEEESIRRGIGILADVAAGAGQEQARAVG